MSMLFSSENNVEKAFDLYGKIKSRMAQGGFKLRKWLTKSNVIEK